MSNALRTRAARLLLATIVFGSAGLSMLVGAGLHVDPLFVHSYGDEPILKTCCFCYEPPLPSCVEREDDDHCFRELHRAQLEALDANRYFDRLSALKQIGASVATSTVVRRPLVGTTY